MTVEAENKLMFALCAGIRPDERLTVSEWSDKYRHLSGDASAEPGLWRTSRVPYMREIMDKLSSIDPTEEVVFMKGAQVGATESGMNWVGYVIDISPGPMLMVQPTEEMCKRNSKIRFDPMVEATSRLRSKILPKRSRDSGNTMLQKEFSGGVIVMTGANSAVGLRSMPVKYLFLDEIDGYPADISEEGSPIELAMARTRTFSRRKVFKCSTPTIEGHSPIAREFDDSDQRYFHLPCPHCGAYQKLIWAQIRWEMEDPDTAHYECIECGARIDEYQKTQMLAAGQWVPENPEKVSASKAGYHLSALYSPVGWYSWKQAVRDFMKAKRDPSLLKVFTNTVWGETWKEKGDAPPWEGIYDRSRTPIYQRNQPPAAVAFITAGVDVQADRLEVEIVGWSRGKVSYSLDYRVLDGDTGSSPVWDDLAKIVDEQWMRADGSMLPLRLMAVDTGYNTTHVYEFCRRYDRSRVIAIKGQDHQTTILSTPKFADIDRKGKRGGKIRIYHVGVSILKSELYAYLKQRIGEDGVVPAGYCYFLPYGEGHFKGLTAEQLEYKIDRKNYGKYQWTKKYERNEQLDCFDERTEVLTKDGWILFSQATESNLFATVDLDTDQIEYQKPLSLIKRHHEGNMIEIKGTRIDVLVTPNHRMVTYKKEIVTHKKNGISYRKWNFDVPAKITLAKDLTIHHQLKCSATWTGENRPVFIPESRKIDSNAIIEPCRYLDPILFANFLGWYVSEGSRSTMVSKTQGNRRYNVEISQNEGEKLDRIIALCEKLPWRFSIQKTHKIGNGRKVMFKSKQLYSYLECCGDGTYEKRVPQWLKDSAPEVILSFFESAISGDGWIHKNEKTGVEFRTYATVSKRLADDIQELFLKTGKASNIKTKKRTSYKIKGRDGVNTVDQYHITELRQVKASLDGGGGGKRSYIGKSIQYSGMVYCAEVPNGTLIVRRNGRVIIAGNCRNYARAAAEAVGMSRWTDRNWDEMNPQPKSKPVQKPPEEQKERKRSSFWD